MTYEDLRAMLTREIDDKYQEFVSRGTPTERPILGIRIPAIRKIAASVPKEDLKNLIENPPFSFEEVLLRGMLISRLSYEDMLKYFDSQVAIINDWGACDNFCASLRPHLALKLSKVSKSPKSPESSKPLSSRISVGSPESPAEASGNKNLSRSLRHTSFYEQKITSLLKSNEEFSVRVGLVLLLNFYLTPDYLQVIFGHIESLRDREEYYIKMALAWLLAECFIKYPDETLSFLNVTRLPKWTFNKTISKICDSFRVEEDMKDYLRTLRK